QARAARRPGARSDRGLVLAGAARRGASGHQLPGELGMKVRLQHLAHARSGDKGNTANIAVIAYEPDFYPLLVEQLSAERVKDFYRGAITGTVERYPIEGLSAINFVCHGALGGGVSRSLCLDNYGKALSAALLGFEIEVPGELAALLRGMDDCAGTRRARGLRLRAAPRRVAGVAGGRHSRPVRRARCGARRRRSRATAAPPKAAAPALRSASGRRGAQARPAARKRQLARFVILLAANVRAKRTEGERCELSGGPAGRAPQGSRRSRPPRRSGAARAQPPSPRRASGQRRAQPTSPRRQ